MVYLLIALGIIWRIFTHSNGILPNFAPIAAIALFGGVYLKKKWAIILPLAAMVVGDFFIGYYTLPILLTVYGSFALIGLAGILVKKYKSVWTITGTAIAGSLLFFIATNFAVWAFTGMYVKTINGLIQCYVYALPFYRNTIAGDLFFTGVLFGSYEFALAYKSRKLGIRRLGS